MLRVLVQHLDLARRCVSVGRYSEALAHAAVVFPDHRLKVRVDCSNIPVALQGPYRNSLSGAFGMWADVLGEPVFQVTETGVPDVVIHFEPDVNDRGMEVCGHSRWTRGVQNPDTRPVVVFFADVSVRTVKPNGQRMTYEELRACAAHELGHVLGLDDSTSVGSLMGPMDFNHPALSIRRDEIEELLRMRDQADQIRSQLARSRSR